MKGLKTILGIALATTGLGGAIAVGAVASNATDNNIQIAQADTARTVYCAINPGTIGSYTLKVNANIGDNNTWRQVTMTEITDVSYSGKKLFTGTFSEKYGGVDALQFQLYDGDTWKSQKQPYSSWTTSDNFANKLFIYDSNSFTDYTVRTITKYAVVDGSLGSSIGTDKIVSGTSYSVPEKIYRSGYSFDGWYTNQACTSSYTARNISANTSLYAKYTSGTWTGSVYLDLRTSGWADAAANYAILFMDKTTYPTEIDEWSSYVTGTVSGEHLVEIPYNIGFNPVQMTIVRYNSTYSQSSWNSEKFPTDGNNWGQTADINYAEMIRIGNASAGKNATYAGYPKVMGGKDSWSQITLLDSVKSNGSHHVEYYSTAVTLETGAEFKIQVAPYESEDYYGGFSTHDSIKGNFSGDQTNNITVVTGGTYSFYFDSIDNKVYITSVDVAAADEWAQYFLANVGCDPNGVNLPSGWSACATEYGKLSGGAKNIIYAADADEDGNYVEMAMARYDKAVTNHSSLTKFVVNSSDVVRASKGSVPVISEQSSGTAIIAVTIISMVGITALGGYFLLKKKKFN